MKLVIPPFLLEKCYETIILPARTFHLTTTPSLYYIAQLIIGSLHPDIGPCLVGSDFQSLSQNVILEERSDEESVPL